MKTRTLISLALASTFGWSAGAFAGSSHEVMTPLSVNESGPVTISHEKGFSGQQPDMAPLGVTSSSASASIGGSFGESAALTPDESLALGDEGIYSDYYVVSWAPVSVQEYYIIDSDQLSWNDDAFSLSPTHELALVPSSSDEMVYDLVLVPVDDVIATYSFDMDTGE